MATDESQASTSSHALSSRPAVDEAANSAAHVNDVVQRKPPSKPAPPPASAMHTPAPLRKASSTSLVASPATGMSPRTSRNTSPIRKDKPQPLSGPLSTQPSAAAIQRALSASNVPQLQNANTPSETLSRLPRAQAGASVSGESSPQWPMSPRVKSPPPATAAGPARKTSVAAPKRSDSSGTPAINVQSATPKSAASISPPAKQGSSEAAKTEQTQQIPIPQPKGPLRGPGGKSTLETVQENSADSVAEPSPAAVLAAADLRPLTRIANESAETKTRDRSRPNAEKHAQAGESGSESAGNRSDHRRGRRSSASKSGSSAAQRPKQTSAKSNYAAMATAKGRQGDGKHNMTVETETVQSIPQSALAPSDRFDNSGSIKLKASNETIRPKKERKKAERKARSINQSTAPTKADLFEARVANAVDEANTSDSDETFVYESNPPEPQRRQRHHSRTPSVTSSHSIADQPRGSMRHYGEGNDDRRVGGKRSMKFSSIYSDVDGPESNDSSTVRSHTPRHIGRFGRGGHHAANHEPDSPFTKLRNNHLNTQRQSRPTSPQRSPPMMPYRPGALFSRKQEQSFDMDADGADDERTPLIFADRSYRYARNAHMRRANGGPHFYARDEPSRRAARTCWCSGRTGAVLLTFLMAVLVMISAFAFVFSSNRPLLDVKIRRIHNVLATEQELAFDLAVSAINPNALGVSASELDLDIFAKSKHIGDGRSKDDDTQTFTKRFPRLRRYDYLTTDVHYDPSTTQDLSNHWHAPDPIGHDHGTSPDDSLEKDTVTVPLGNVSHFDQALAFEPSPIKRIAHVTTGSLRLKKPGNTTDDSANSERWAKMLDYPFELIVRGVLRYQLPISARWQNAAISSAVMVHPEEGISREGNMRVVPIDLDERWQWIEWPDDGEDADEDESI